MPLSRDEKKPIVRQDLLPALQGYYATTVLLQLRRLRVLDELRQPKTPALLAKKLGVDAVMTKQLLDFLTVATSVIRPTRGGAYQLNEPSHAELIFQLEKFAGAYGPAAEALSKTLLNPNLCKKHVDEQALATAYAEAETLRGSLIPDLIASAGVKCLLDLGCGQASLLVDLARRDRSFYGIGIDANTSMCAQARRAIRLAGLSRRIVIHHGDAANPNRYLSKALRNRVDGLFAGSFLNEFFGKGEQRIVQLLKRLSQSFLGRRAWFFDYYSTLGHSKRRKEPALLPLAMLQDLAQIVSGQGIPPENAVTWRRLYKKAGCQLIELQEFESASIRWFIQTVKL